MNRAWIETQVGLPWVVNRNSSRV